MKRMIVFTMLALCLFGAVAVANAATELTEDQMARQFGGTFLDPETNCIPGLVADQHTWQWYFGCSATGEECSHDDETDNYVIVCVCEGMSATYYYLCKNDDDGFYVDPEGEYIWPQGFDVIFDEDTYPVGGGYPPFPF